ncbi:MAG: GIY-YIG nuclease family protein [Verrucomicrobiales bacterium]|nr:GIY-YIG nuclease family protein [Verrucomicrobiales bacterium]
MTNANRTLYIGVTANVLRRVWLHRTKKVAGFTKRYNLTILVYTEAHPTMLSAIAREKQLKGWRRDKKIWLIEQRNPHWEDLWPSLVAAW